MINSFAAHLFHSIFWTIPVAQFTYIIRHFKFSAWAVSSFSERSRVNFFAKDIEEQAQLKTNIVNNAIRFKVVGLFKFKL